MARKSQGKHWVAPFWEKVQKGKPDECWPWEGYVCPSGHGSTTLDYVSMGAHRKAWILTHGPIRGELCVNHRCDNKLCCNPAHLYLGTRMDNMVDRWASTPGHERGPGRTTVLTTEQLGELVQMRAGGKKLTECATHFNVHVATICRYLTPARRAKLERMRRDKLSSTSHSDL